VEDNIKKALQAVESEGVFIFVILLRFVWQEVVWINLAQNRGKERAPVEAVMNIWAE
jgi:hypothetical protein